MMILYRKVSILLLMTLFFCGCTTQERFEPGYKPTIQPIDNVYNPKTVIYVTGTIKDTTGFDYEDGLEIVTLDLLDADNKRYAISLGPAWFLNVKNASYQIGDKITVEGSLVRFDEEEEEEEEIDDYETIEMEDYLFIARKVIKDGKKLILRSKSGKPRWFRRGLLMGVKKNVGKRRDLRVKGVKPPNLKESTQETTAE